MFDIPKLVFILFGTAAAISDGRPFPRGQVKFAAYIDVPHQSTHCSAVIVSQTHTLSAAICQPQHRLPVPAVAYAGNNRYTVPRDFIPPVQSRIVDEWIFYDSNQKTRLEVSLQKLAAPWMFNDFVEAIPLASEPALPEGFSRRCEVYGFGCSGPGRNDSGVGRVAVQVVSSWRACLTQRDERVMCAGDRAVCAGDEGGPVCCADQQGRARLYGIVLQGENPAFAYIGYFKWWVSQQVGVEALRLEGPATYVPHFLVPVIHPQKRGRQSETGDGGEAGTPNPGPPTSNTPSPPVTNNPNGPPVHGSGEVTTTETGCLASLSYTALVACLAAAALL